MRVHHAPPAVGLEAARTRTRISLSFTVKASQTRRHLDLRQSCKVVPYRLLVDILNYPFSQVHHMQVLSVVIMGTDKSGASANTSQSRPEERHDPGIQVYHRASRAWTVLSSADGRVGANGAVRIDLRPSEALLLRAIGLEDEKCLGLELGMGQGADDNSGRQDSQEVMILGGDDGGVERETPDEEMTLQYPGSKEISRAGSVVHTVA